MTMKIQRSRVTAFIGLLALVAGSIPSSALGQEKTIEKKKSQDGISIEKSATLGGGINPDVLHPETDVTVKFLEARFAFDKLVKAAPYSATAVTETTQTLSDGNQIIRKSEVRLYRDSEGRTRRESIGKDPSVVTEVFISDPASGINYSLDPQRRVAVKSQWIYLMKLDLVKMELDQEMKKVAREQELKQPTRESVPEVAV